MNAELGHPRTADEQRAHPRHAEARAEPSTDVPAIVLAFADHWTCVMLRAELIERTHDAMCVPDLAAILVTAHPHRMGGDLVVVMEDLAWEPRTPLILDWLRAMDVVRSAILVTTATTKPVPGSWDRVLRRPVTMGGIANTIDDEIATRVTMGASPPYPRGTLPVRGTRGCPPNPHQQTTVIGACEVRVGPPWPMARCQHCGAARHCALPRTRSERGLVRQALLQFGLEHDEETA